MEAIEEISYKGYEIAIVQDDYPQSPDDWGDDENFLVYDTRQFYVERKGFDPDDIFQTMQEGKKLFDGYFYFPVYAYIHSGVSLRLSRWFPGLPQGHNEFDVSFKGFALVKRQKGTYTREKSFKIAESIIEEWNDYLSGNIYGYEISKNDDIIDSCYGFYGDYEKSGMIDEAKNVVDYKIKNSLKKRISQLKTWIKNHVPFEIRQKEILEFS